MHACMCAGHALSDVLWTRMAASSDRRSRTVMLCSATTWISWMIFPKRCQCVIDSSLRMTGIDIVGRELEDLQQTAHRAEARQLLLVAGRDARRRQHIAPHLRLARQRCQWKYGKVEHGRASRAAASMTNCAAKQSRTAH